MGLIETKSLALEGTLYNVDRGLRVSLKIDTQLQEICNSAFQYCYYKCVG